MLCSKCKNQLPDGAKFCSTCGSAVEPSTRTKDDAMKKEDLCTKEPIVEKHSIKENPIVEKPFIKEEPIVEKPFAKEEPIVTTQNQTDNGATETPKSIKEKLQEQGKKTWKRLSLFGKILTIFCALLLLLGCIARLSGHTSALFIVYLQFILLFLTIFSRKRKKQGTKKKSYIITFLIALLLLVPYAKLIVTPTTTYTKSAITSLTTPATSTYTEKKSVYDEYIDMEDAVLTESEEVEFEEVVSEEIVSEEIDMIEEDLYLTIENNEDFASLMQLTDQTDAATIKSFAIDHVGDVVAFDGCVMLMFNHGDYQTRFDLAMVGVDYDATRVYGPIFAFEDVSFSEMHVSGTDTVTEGMNFTITGEITGFNEAGSYIALDPVSMSIRYTTSASIETEATDVTSETISSDYEKAFVVQAADYATYYMFDVDTNTVINFMTIDKYIMQGNYSGDFATGVRIEWVNDGYEETFTYADGTASASLTYDNGSGYTFAVCDVSKAQQALDVLTNS